MEQKKQYFFIGWTVIAVALFSAIAVYFVENLMWSFLILLLLNVAASVGFKRHFSRNALIVCRILIGCLFIFSGFVKAVDPMGTVFKMEEYMTAYGTEWANPLVPVAAILLIVLEFSLGCFAILNIKPRWTIFGIALMMAGFTVLTFLDAINNPVSDCGCFGDFVKMSNWQTFYKNLVIDALLLSLLLNIKTLRTKRSNISQFAVGGFIVVMMLGVEIYTYFHLPLIDFLPWKVGSKTVIENRLPVQYFFTCKNKQTGVVQEFPYEVISADLADSTWNATWEIVSRRDIDPNPNPHNMRITDLYGDDVTASILESETPIFVATVYNTESWHSGALGKLEQLYNDATTNGYDFVMLIDASPEEAQIFIDENNITFPVYTTDAIEMKMMNRSNPGVTLLDDKTVIKKWDYHNIPYAGVFDMVIPKGQ